uniref:vomeronasal type-1 receptor 4-like n=1 Tax=Jaculus jaculus TaxID=51337 RepID=UPI001E1B3A6D|nr:vomeronasal type-1 receptor 4-like [Jaculus jaculus]
MSASTLARSIIFASQTGVGILGNILLLSCHVFMSHTGQRLKDIDLILNNLTLANCLVLLSKGIPQTMLSLGMTIFLGDWGCKLVFYLHRVARGVSLGTTCILSCFQAIKISPGSAQWMKVKATHVRYTRFSITFCWTFHMLVNIIVINNIKGPRESNNHTNIKNFGYCSGAIFDRTVSTLYISLLSSIDVMSLGCMVCASGFMMFILYKHKQTVLYIHKKTGPPKLSAETKATQSIIILVSTFFCFYLLSLFFTVYIDQFDKPSLWLVDTSALMAASFPCLCPFVLISRDPLVSRRCFTCCVMINSFWKEFRAT